MKAKKKLLRTIALLLVSVMLFQNGLSSAYAMENQLVGSTGENLELVNLGDGQDGVDPNGNNAQPVNTQDGLDNNSSTTADNESTPVVGEDDSISTPTGGEGNDASTNPTEEGENESTPVGGNDVSATPTGEGENESTPVGENDVSATPTGEGEDESTPVGGNDVSTAPTGEGENESTPTSEAEEDSQEPEGNEEPLMMTRSMARDVQSEAEDEENGGIGQWGDNNNRDNPHVIVGWYEKSEDKSGRRPISVTVNWEDSTGYVHKGTVILGSDDHEKYPMNESTMKRDLTAYGGEADQMIDRWKIWPHYNGSKENKSVTYEFPNIDGYTKKIDGDCGVIYIKSDTKPQGTGTIIINKTTTGAETPNSTVFDIIDFNTEEVKKTVSYTEFINIEDNPNNKTLTVELPVGDYIIRERGAEIDGYILTVTGSKADHDDETNSGPEASVSIESEGAQDTAQITNEYNTTTALVEFQATKTLDGTTQGLSDDEFTFVIKEENTEVARAKNKADGSITFPKIFYNKVGTHNYTISEVKGDSSNIKYDENSYNVSVTVKYDQNGNLTATADYGEIEKIVFNNYTLIDIPVTKTWDDSNNQDGKRPESIRVRLYANGREIQDMTIKSVDNWKYTFTELPEFDENSQERECETFSVNNDMEGLL